MLVFGATEAVISHLEDESLLSYGPSDLAQLTVVAVDVAGEQRTLIFEHRALQQFAHLIRAMDKDLPLARGH